MASKKFLAVFACGLILFGKSSFAVSHLFGVPAKLSTCEQMLKISNRFSATTDVYDTLDALVEKLSHDNGDKRVLGVTYTNVYYNGPADKISTRKAEVIQKRVNGIALNFVGQNPNVMTIAMEVRGKRDIAIALHELQRRKAKMRNDNDAFEEGLKTWVVSPGIDVLTAIFTIPTSFGWVGGVQTGVWALFIYRSLLYHIDRLDLSHRSFNSAIKKILEKPNSDEIFISSDSVNLSTSWENSSFTVHLIKSLMPKSRRSYQRRGLNRTIYFDQIIFYDDAAKEPVWLFFYRAFKHNANTPINRPGANYSNS